MVINSSEHALQSLRKFKELSSDRNNHKELLADKKAILYAATSLEDDNPEVLELCLDIFDNFLDNEENHVSLISTFGVYESLESLTIRIRNVNEGIFKRASDITDILRNSKPPAFSTRSKTKGGKFVRKQTVHLLYIPNLTQESKQTFENALVRIKGVVSFLIDMNVKRCTLRICPKVTVKEVVEKILGKCRLRCLVVWKNKEEGVESYYDILANTPNRSYLEYVEEDFLQKSGAVQMVQNDRKSESGFLSSVKTFWQESFYW